MAGWRSLSLQRIGPAGKIGITAIGQEQRSPTCTFDPQVVLRRKGQDRVRCPAQTKYRMIFFNCRMPEAHVECGDEIEHELEVSFLQEDAQPTREGGVTSQFFMDRVPRNGEPRAGDVLVAQIGQGFLKFFSPVGIAARNPLCSRAPFARRSRNQIQSKPFLCQRIEFGVGNVIQGRPGPRVRTNSVSQTRVLIWYRTG